MKKSLFKIFLVIFLVSLPLVSSETGSYFSDTVTSSNNTFATACWDKPSIPVLTYPSNNTYAGAGSAWDLNPYMDWNDSTTTCPLTNPITYQYEVYRDSGLTLLIYQSGWLSNSMIPAPGTPEGTYYWRVRAQDSFGNTSDFSAPWLLVVDRTAPVISNVVHLLATPEEADEHLATITWNTNELATSNLRWSNDGGATWTDLPADTTADNTSHSREITGLSATTTYNYEVKSKDQAGNETTSSGYSFTTGGGDTSDFVATTDVVINEFLIDPIGADNAPMPGGEWVELYNKSATTSYDLTGWSISAYASSPTYRLYLTTTNTVSSDPGTTGLTIGPHEFFVVYRNGDATFEMSNISDDRIRLFDNVNPNRIDGFMYTASQVIENKSIARFPDGSDTWFDPIPTPLEPNVLELMYSSSSPILDLILSDDKKSVSFKVTNIKDYSSLSYELTYTAYDMEKGIVGSGVDITGQTEYEKTDLDLATCSDGACAYDQNVHNFQLKITLVDKDGKQTVLQQSL